MRNALAYATHKFFQENGFVWVSSPIVTASDCEGAGEQFCVTTLVCDFSIYYIFALEEDFIFLIITLHNFSFLNISIDYFFSCFV